MLLVHCELQAVRHNAVLLREHLGLGLQTDCVLCQYEMQC